MPKTSMSRVVRAPRDEIWAVLSDVTAATRWNRAWTAIELLGSQTHGVGTRFRAKTDRDETFDFEVCEWVAPERIAFCPLRDRGELYSIMLDAHIFELKPVGEGETEVTLTAKASSHGLRGRVIAMFFWAGHQQAGLDVALDAVQGVFEPETLVEVGDEPEPLTE